ncbi:MAG: NAD(P)/FAD-dependent oxidoreductase [Clostridia bacterium]|nr:NAD(P)/FAD-dependent oxidoreductase [Clostridia bacterium]
MNEKKLRKKLNELYGGKIQFTDKNRMRVMTGEWNTWDGIVNACQMAVTGKKDVHVVNNIRFTGGKIPEMRLPSLSDNALEGKKPDVLIIGGGISGVSIARELSKWNLEILLVEKESDLALGASGRNDGEVHPGVDLSKGSLKQHYVLLGNEMYGDICRELGVPFSRCGQYVGFTQKELKPFVEAYAAKRRMIDGVKDTKVISREELFAAEPNLNKDFQFALYNPSAGCVCPYSLTIAYAENAVKNGVKLSLNTAVLSMETKNGKILSVKTNRGTVYPKTVINAAGVFADDIAEMAGDRFYSIHPRRGTNSILDTKAGAFVHSVVTIKTLQKSAGHTKGGGILHTVHHNLLVGPDAVETFEKENYATNPESITNVFKKQQGATDKLRRSDIITYFTGVRAPSFEEDFIIERGRETQNLIHCAGIQSPGLTTAPAVAKDIEKMTLQALRCVGVDPKRNDNYNPHRDPIPHLRDMAPKERAALIKKNPDYGEIVCRCEEISKGEILDALRSPICVPTVDGVKKRVRAGMGRCQGGFCSPVVMKIIAEFLGVTLSEVRKSNSESVIVFGETKEGK